MNEQEQFRRWQQLDAAHFLHPFSDTKQIGERGTRIITRGEGVYLYDGEGRKLLDGMSGLWCVAVGYGARHLARERLMLLAVPAIVATSFFFIADIDSPRAGVIRVIPQNLHSLAQSLAPK